MDNTSPAYMQILKGKKLKQIFLDHWEAITDKYARFLLRPAIAENINKMLRCGTEAMGFKQYQCPQCGLEKKVFFTCKSRFCPSCGAAQTKRWKEKFNLLFAHTAYKHIVFHPPSEFWDYFKIGKAPYYNMLFTTSHQALQAWYAKKGYLPGIMTVLHTFGRDEGFTPHTHLLITCGGLDRTQTRWFNAPSDGFIPHEVLRKHFREKFLINMKELWKNQRMEDVPLFKHVMFTPVYQNDLLRVVLEKVWFVWISKKIEKAFKAVSYVARYTKRPPIAESNITAYDGKMVDFTFVEHKTNKPKCLTLSAEEFIKLLIRHIPDNNFRMVRYYGFLSNRVRGKLLPKVFTLLGDNYYEIKAEWDRLSSWWRRQLELFTHLDPLICQVCFVPLELVSTLFVKMDAYG